jgi:hypothetical protein
METFPSCRPLGKQTREEVAEGAGGRNNMRLMAAAPGRSGEVQGSFRRGGGRSIGLDQSDGRCSVASVSKKARRVGMYVLN